MHTTRQAIDASIQALKDGMSPLVLKSALVSDGFQKCKADIIIRWATQYLRKRKEYGNISVNQRRETSRRF